MSKHGYMFRHHQKKGDKYKEIWNRMSDMITESTKHSGYTIYIPEEAKLKTKNNMKTLNEIKDKSAQDCYGKNWNELTREEMGYMVDVVATAYALEHIQQSSVKTMEIFNQLNTK